MPCPPELEREIAAAYAAGESSVALATRYHTNPVRVLAAVRRQGGTVRPFTEACRRYAVDHAFFEHIDTPAKAYWLGFVLADGCIRDLPQSPSLVVTLARRDEDHVQHLRDALRATYPLYTRPDRATLVVTSARLVAYLAVWGIVPRKTLDETEPRVPHRFETDFWRGVIEGYGCVCVSAPGTVSLSGSFALLDAFQHFCRRNVPTSKAVPRRISDTRAWQFTVGDSGVRAVARVLYQDAPVALPRKHANVMALLDLPPSRGGRQPA